MAENEVLDFGHRERWRKSRNLLRDPTCTLDQFVSAATQDCRDAVRRLPAALRKGPPLLTLMRALQAASIAGLQEVVATFTEKRLANIVLATARCARTKDPQTVARSASESIIETLVDQIAVRAKKEKRFCSIAEQAGLRNSLVEEFSTYVAPLSETIESSLRGAPIRRMKVISTSPARLTSNDVARMSLVAPSVPLEQPHAP